MSSFCVHCLRWSAHHQLMSWPRNVDGRGTHLDVHRPHDQNRDDQSDGRRGVCKPRRSSDECRIGDAGDDKGPKATIWQPEEDKAEPIVRVQRITCRPDPLLQGSDRQSCAAGRLLLSKLAHQIRDRRLQRFDDTDAIILPSHRVPSSYGRCSPCPVRRTRPRAAPPELSASADDRR